MKLYDTLLFDVDDTLLDFERGATYALEKVFHQLGLPASSFEEAHTTFEQISKPLWEEVERGERTVESVATVRFHQLLAHYGKEGDGAAVDRYFRQSLSDYDFSIEGAHQVVATLAEHYPLYVVSNGLYETQTERLRGSRLLHYFEKRFTSSQFGISKPDVRFFEEVEKRIPLFDRARALIIGDSLSSDIEGGRRAQIDTCWYNPKATPIENDATYVITSLDELLPLLIKE